MIFTITQHSSPSLLQEKKRLLIGGPIFVNFTGGQETLFLTSYYWLDIS